MEKVRTESDGMGTIDVPENVLWGAGTARSLQFFSIGDQRMPLEIIHALAWIKWAAALVNGELQLLDMDLARTIAEAARRVAQGEFDAEFPLSVWQTGSGTQSNMNVNEVVAHLATRSLVEVDSTTCQVHPNDHVNWGQSSNDVFPSAMHIAVLVMLKDRLLPALSRLHEALLIKSVLFKDVIKLGRTHWQDATPISLGQEFGGYAAQLALCDEGIRHAQQSVCALAIGGTAVGTGLNTHPEFGPRVAKKVSDQLGLPMRQAANLFAAMAGHEPLVALHASCRTLAIALTKISNDIRVMGSGPRAGLGELQLPENEPGSSIMPGKVNPTQIEALTMVCAQVMGHDTALGFAASQGHFELNVYKPLIAFNVLDSIRLLADAMQSFRQHCLTGIRVNEPRVKELLNSSLMLVTALAPHLGYDRSAQIAKAAYQRGVSLREAALDSGHLTAAQFDAWVDPAAMVG